MKNSLLVLFSLIFCSASMAADYYWVSGNGEFNNPENWSNKLGGPPANKVPGIDDDVHIIMSKQNSVEIKVVGIQKVKSLEIYSPGNLKFTGNGEFRIYNSFDLHSDIDFEPKLVFYNSSKVNFHAHEANVDILVKGSLEVFTNLSVGRGNIQLDNGSNFIVEGDNISCQDLIAKNGSSMSVKNSTVNIHNNLSIANNVQIVSSDNIILVPDAQMVIAGDEFEDSEIFKGTNPCQFPGGGTITATITSDYNGVFISCNGASDGEITITTSGIPGAPFLYAIDPPGTALVVSNVFPNLPLGSYTFLVYSAADTSLVCFTQIQLPEPFVITPVLNQFQPAVCYDSCNAISSYTITGGTPGYNIDFPFSGLNEQVGSASFGQVGGLCAGDNPFTVTDTNGCAASNNVIITQPDSISTTFTSQDPSCLGDCNGWIVAQPSGGNGSNYSFDWTPGNPIGDGTDSISSLCSGTYTVRIEDDSSCFNIFSHTIIDPPVFQAQLTNPTNILCFGACDGSITALPINGNGPYTFQWLDGANAPIGNTDSIATGLCPGTYRVIVTDFNGCIDTTSSVNLTEPLELDVTALATQPSCYGVFDGSAVANSTGGVTPYSYQWVNDGTGAQIGANPTINGLGSGTYYVVVTDSNNCQDSSTIFPIIWPDSIVIVLTAYDPTCYDLCNGSVGAVVTGGSAPFTYTWSPGNPTGQGTDSITSLCPGSYDLLIEDNNNCTETETIIVNPVPQYDLTINSSDLSCNGADDGTIDVTVNSGADGGPYTVVWTPVPPGGQQGNFSLSNLPAGTWQATIQDGLGCDTMIQIDLNEPISIQVNAFVNSNATCFADCNGAAGSIVIGEQGNVVYSWNDPSTQNTANATGLCAGQYIITVTDSALCTDSDTIVITQPSQITFDTSTTAPSCWNICDATASVSNLAGGTGILSVQWTDPLNQTSLTATGLCGGPIDVTISDQNACDTTISLTIPTPTAILGPISNSPGTCFGTCTGEGYLDISGGVPGYTVNWFDATNGVNLGVNNDTITGLCQGTYTATVEDASGCILDADTITIIELPELTISLNSMLDASCGLCDGQADVSAVGGTGPLIITWFPAPASGANGTTKNDLCEGIYTVRVTDSVGCSDFITITIDGIADENITMDSTATSCYNTCDGTATANYACLVPPCTITWFDDMGAPIGQVGDVATNLCPGVYTAQLENAGGCFAYQSVTIDAPDTIEVFVNTFSHPTCNGICDGEILLTQTGGVAPLTTTWTPQPLAGQGTNHAQGLCAGWNVYVVEDFNGCQYSDSLELIDNPPLDVSNFGTTDITCFGANDGQAAVAPNGGVPNYTIEWFTCAGVNTGITGPLAIGLVPGSYYAQVTDAAGCVQITPCDSVRDRIPLTLTLDSNSVSCSGICDGQLSAIISGGTPNYFYQWLDQNQDTIPGETNDSLSNICSGTFYLRVSDQNACDSTFGPFTLQAPISWDVTITADSATCNGISDGSGTVLVNAGNTAPYSYLWNPSGIITPIATPIAAGIYDVTITDASGVCDTIVQVEILEPAPLMFNPSITAISCFDQCDGGIDLGAISGGTPNYNYLWDGLPGGSSITNQCADTFDIRLIDANACFKDTTIILDQPLEINANLIANMATCNICNGSASSNPTGGSGNYNYNWSPAPIPGQGTQNVTDLCPNIYSLIVTDDNGCIDTTSFIVDNVNADTLTMSADSASCSGVCDGAAYVSFNCSVPNCTVDWFLDNTFNNLGISDTTVQNACSGVYFAVLENGEGCISIDSITVGEPAEITTNDSITPPTCFNGTDGQIIVNPSGGTGTGYLYNWTPVPGGGQGTNTATGLSPGDWIVDIIDSDGCSTVDTLTVPNSIEIVYTMTSSNVTCTGACDGTGSASAAGIAPLSYQWFNSGVLMPGETNPNIFGLCPGTYYVEITDDAGCTIQSTDIIITEPNPLTGGLDSLRNPLCSGDCNGILEISISGGTIPYTINWYDGSGNLIGQIDTVAIGLCAGDYYAEITDSNGCMITTPTYTLTDPNPFVVNLTTVTNSCFGTCDGYVVANASGGTTPYSWSFTDTLNNNLPNVIGDSTFNLCTGTYVVEVSDSNGCSFGPQQVFLQSPSEITANTYSNDATCGLSDGDATVQLITGDPPFTYQWMDASFTPLVGENAATISNIGSGTYYVEVTDSNGCIEQFSVNVSNPVVTTLVWDTLILPTCNGDCNGAIEITATAVTPPLSYLWNSGGITDEDPSGLCAGNYSVQLTDAAGCVNFYDTTLIDPPAIQNNFNITTPTCGLCNGEILANVTGGNAPIDLIWSNGDTGMMADSICAGVYDLIVEDAIGCQVIFNSTISNNPNGIVDIDESITPETCFGSCDGMITINPTVTATPYVIFWLHDGSNSTTLNNLCAGDYFVQVADSNDCVETQMLTISAPSEIVATADIIPPSCGNSDGSITINSDGGALPHTYSWDSGELTQGIINKGAGIYTVTITDDNGCTEEILVPLANEDGPTVSIDSSSISCFGNCDGQLNALITGGTPTYNYEWFDGSGVAIGQTDSFAVNLCEGNYIIEVTDASNCIGFGASVVEDADTLIISLPVVSNISCFGACDGQINYIVSGGTQPYSYSWNDPGNSAGLNADSLCAGTFTAEITDANGCMITDSATVIEPSEIVITLDSMISASCVNSPDGEIYQTISGGTPTYTVSWTSEDGSFTSSNEDINGLFPMEYYMQVTDASGCTVFDTVAVDTSLILIANAGNDTIICDQEQLELNGTVTATGAATVQWTDSLGNVLSDSLMMIDNPDVGVTMYVFNVTQGVCTSSDTVFVTVAAPFTVDAGDDQQILVNESTSIGGAPTAPDSVIIAWTPTFFLDDSTATNPNVIEAQQTMIYTVYVTDTNGCVYSDSVIVEVLPDIVIISGFTPNGDGVNDVWELDFSIYFPGLDVFVYNRWGEELFRSSGYATPWDGKFKGKDLPVGTYYYIIQLNDEKYPDPFSGPVTIMR